MAARQGASVKGDSVIPSDLLDVIRPRCRFVPPDAALDIDAPLLELGVDSLEMVELIIEIEDTFHLEVPPELLTPEVFTSIRTIWDNLIHANLFHANLQASGKGQQHGGLEARR